MLNTKMIGQKISDVRKKTNVSQAWLADQLFISSQAVGKWERGESLPDIIMLSKLAQILGVDLNYFTEENERPAKEINSAATEEQSAKDEPAKAQFQNRKPSWDMSRGNWVDADFSGLKNLQEKFSSSNMQRCIFTGSDLSGLLLKGNNVDRCDFSDSNIGGSHIQGSHLAGNAFRNCLLKEAEFSGSHIQGCDFSGADFTGTIFKSSSMEKVTLENAVWNRTVFNGTYIGDTVFEGTLEDCSFENCGFKRVTFRNSTLLNSFFKNNDGLKRVKFTDCKADKLTYAFLKNGKADLSGVEMIGE